MISAQNRLLPLSGNKRLWFLITALVLAACSPKLQPVAPVKKPAEKVPEKPKVRADQS